MACGWKRARRVRVGMGCVGESEGVRGTAGRRGLWEQAGARGELGRGVGCWRGREREGVETGWAAGVDVGRVGLGLLGWVCLFYFYSSLFSISNSNKV